MNQLYVYTLYDKTDKPRMVGVKSNDNIIITELYKGKGYKNPLSNVYNKLKKIRKIVTKAEREGQVILSDFKRFIKTYQFEVSSKRYEIYDIQLPDIRATEDKIRNEEIVTKVLDKLSIQNIKIYQKLLANAQVVYNELEKRGVCINHVMHYPEWYVNTYSGRSKNTSVNIQGWADNDIVRPPGFTENDVLIHFDWISADIRVASLLSNDDILSSSFDNSDPYDHMVEIINKNNQDKITRDECKLLLLKAINSLDYDNVAMLDMYKKLGKWIYKCKCKIQNDAPLETILGKQFSIRGAKNHLAVMNGVMQGSVAHAMHNVVRQVWEKFPNKIVTEIHDSLVVSCYNDPGEVKATIAIVADIMLYPFRGMLESNPAFPIKVSVGKRWKKWKHIATFRDNGVTYVKR